MSLLLATTVQVGYLILAPSPESEIFIVLSCAKLFGMKVSPGVTTVEVKLLSVEVTKNAVSFGNLSNAKIFLIVPFAIVFPSSRIRNYYPSFRARLCANNMVTSPLEPGIIISPSNVT